MFVYVVMYEGGDNNYHVWSVHQNEENAFKEMWTVENEYGYAAWVNEEKVLP